jgi:hypothetical protein
MHTFSIKWDANTVLYSIVTYDPLLVMCYVVRCWVKDLWCSSTVWLLSTQNLI